MYSLFLVLRKLSHKVTWLLSMSFNYSHFTFLAKLSLAWVLHPIDSVFPGTVTVTCTELTEKLSSSLLRNDKLSISKV